MSFKKGLIAGGIIAGVLGLLGLLVDRTTGTRVAGAMGNPVSGWSTSRMGSIFKRLAGKFAIVLFP